MYIYTRRARLRRVCKNRDFDLENNLRHTDPTDLVPHVPRAICVLEVVALTLGFTKVKVGIDIL